MRTFAATHPSLINGLVNVKNDLRKIQVKYIQTHKELLHENAEGVLDENAEGVHKIIKH